MTTPDQMPTETALGNKAISYHRAQPENNFIQEDITMAKTISMTCERKEGRKWVETYASTNAEHCYQMYAGHLYDKYIAKAPYIKRVTDKCNYDGTRTITFYQTNDYRTTYIIPR